MCAQMTEEIHTRSPSENLRRFLYGINAAYYAMKRSAGALQRQSMVSDYIKANFGEKFEKANDSVDGVNVDNNAKTKEEILLEKYPNLVKFTGKHYMCEIYQLVWKAALVLVSRVDDKKCTLYIYGPSNTGKTRFTDLLATVLSHRSIRIKGGWTIIESNKSDKNVSSSPDRNDRTAYGKPSVDQNMNPDFVLLNELKVNSTF